MSDSISCVMPTTLRRRWCIPLAIRCFQHQIYPNRELVIVFDGPGSIADLVPDDPQIRLVTLDGKRTLGAKFNACVEHARHRWVALWADDDWHAPQRLHVTMNAATTHGVAIASTHKRLFYVLQNGQRWLYDYGRNPVKLDYVLGGTLLFRKTVWDTAKFPELNAAVDNGFIVDALQRDRVPYTIVDDETLYVAMIHDDNTRQPWNPLFPYTEWFGNIAGVMGADFDRYQKAWCDKLK